MKTLISERREDPYYGVQAQVYGIVREHLLSQMDKSFYNTPDGRDDACAYRGRNGMSCAIGCLIPDEYYSTVIEGAMPSLVSEMEPTTGGHALSTALSQVFGISYNLQTLRLLSQLQDIHDNCDVKDWEGELDSLGVDWGFDTWGRN